MPPQFTDDTLASELPRRAASFGHSRPTTEWLLVAACAFAAISAAVDSQLWPATGFSAIGAAQLLRASGVSDRSDGYRWLVYGLLAFAIVLYVVHMIVRISGSAG